MTDQAIEIKCLKEELVSAKKIIQKLSAQLQLANQNILVRGEKDQPFEKALCQSRMFEERSRVFEGRTKNLYLLIGIILVVGWLIC